MHDFWDVFTVKVRPSDGVIYAGSYLSGLAQIPPDGTITIYDQDNSTIGGTVGDPGANGSAVSPSIKMKIYGFRITWPVSRFQ